MMVRKSALLVMGVVGGLGGLLTWLVSDQLVEGIAENQLSAAVGAKVEIDGLDFSLLDMRARLERIQIADPSAPMRNLLETGAAEFTVDGLQLFARKLVIDRMRIDGLTSGTVRTTSGALSAVPKPSDGGGVSLAQVEEQMARFGVETPKVDLSALGRELNLGPLVEGQELESLSALKESAGIAGQRYGSWNERLQGNPFAADLQRLRNEYAKLQQVKVDDLPGLKQAVDQGKALAADARATRDRVRALNTEARADLKRLETWYPDLKGSVAADVIAVRQLANIGDVDVLKVGQAIFGPALIERLKTWLGYAAMAGSLVRREEAEDYGAVPRRAGRLVHFAQAGESLPRFLIREAGVSGSTSTEAGAAKTVFDLTARDLTSSAKVLGRPAVVQGEVIRGGDTWQLEGKIDRLGERPLDRFTLTGKGVRLGEIALQTDPGSAFPATFVPQDADVTTRFEYSGGRLEATVRMSARTVRFAYAGNGPAAGVNPTAYRAMRSVFDEVRSVTLDAEISGKPDALRFKVRSNLDEILYRKIRELMGRKLEEAERQVRAAIDQRLTAYRKEAEDRLTGQRDAVQSRLDALQAQADAVVAQVEAKQQEYQQRLSAEQKKLEEKAGAKQKTEQKKLENKLKEGVKKIF